MSFRFLALGFLAMSFDRDSNTAGKIALADRSPLVDRLIVESKPHLANSYRWATRTFPLATMSGWFLVVIFCGHLH